MIKPCGNQDFGLSTCNPEAATFRVLSGTGRRSRSQHLQVLTMLKQVGNSMNLVKIYNATPTSKSACCNLPRGAEWLMMGDSVLLLSTKLQNASQHSSNHLSGTINDQLQTGPQNEDVQCASGHL